MDNLAFAINPLLVVKGADCNSPGYPASLNSFDLSHHQGVAGMLRNGGRFTPEWVAGIGPESVAGLERKTQ
jgi:hypothetical protein